MIAKKAKEQQGARTDICQNSDKSIVDAIDTKREIARIAGVSHDTVARVPSMAAAALPARLTVSCLRYIAWPRFRRCLLKTHFEPSAHYLIRARATMRFLLAVIPLAQQIFEGVRRLQPTTHQTQATRIAFKRLFVCRAYHYTTGGFITP